MTAASAPQQLPIISRILLAVDFGPSLSAAAALARTFTKVYNARLWVAHVVEPAAPPDAAFIHSAGALEYAEQHMARVMESESWRNVRCESVIRAGALWPVLARVVEENGIDLIVAGAHGHNWLRTMVLGSGAEVIVRNATCPVLTVSSRSSGRAGDGILRILVPLDCRLSAESALAYTARLANAHNAQVVFVHVLHREAMPLDYPDEETIDDDRYVAAMARLSEIIPHAERFRREPEVIIESGVPADVIVAVAQRAGADLIAMPVRRAPSGTGRRAPWKTATRVISDAPCPVLTLAE